MLGRGDGRGRWARAEVWVGPSAWEAARWEREEKSGLRGVGLGLLLGFLLFFISIYSLFSISNSNKV